MSDKTTNNNIRNTEAAVLGRQYGPRPSIQPEKRSFEGSIDGFQMTNISNYIYIFFFFTLVLVHSNSSIHGVNMDATNVCMYVCVCTYVCMYICMYVCMYYIGL